MMWLLKLLNPLGAIAKEIARVRVESINAESEAHRVNAEAELRQLELQQQILIAEQSNILTRLVRPLWAAPFIIYTWKVIVWDKVLKLGVTDPLDEKMWGLMMLIAGAYFVFRGAQTIARMWRRT